MKRLTNKGYKLTFTKSWEIDLLKNEDGTYSRFEYTNDGISVVVTDEYTENDFAEIYKVENNYKGVVIDDEIGWDGLLDNDFWDFVESYQAEGIIESGHIEIDKSNKIIIIECFG